MGTKISEFSNGTLPLAGTELVPIVQGGSTVKTTASAFSTLAPVQSVAARTGNVVLGIADIGNLQTTLDDKLSISGGVISVNSSTDALRITQTGAGNALVVEDSANPDATPFVVTADGNVRVGTTVATSTVGANHAFSIFRDTPAGGIVVSSLIGETIAPYNQVQAYQTSPTFQLWRANGTAASPGAVVNGDNLGTLEFAGRPPSVSYSVKGADISAFITGTPTSTSLPTSLAIGTTPNGSTVPVERLRIDSSGNVGIGTSAPANKLSVVGDASFGALVTTGNSASTADCAIEIGGNRTGNGSAYVDLHTTAGADFEARLGREPGTNGAASLANAGTGALYVTQINAAPIIFQTSNVEKVRIDSSGNVGIGTNVPGSKLQVVASTGTIASFAGSDVAGFIGTRIYTQDASASVARTLFLDFANESGTNVSNVHSPINTDGSSSIYFSTTPAGSRTVDRRVERMRVDSAGNVGIGTSSPGATLHVTKTQASLASVVKIENLSAAVGSAARFDMATGTANSYATLAVTDSATPYSEWACGAGVTGGMYISSATTSAPIILRQSSTERMRIDGSGNICIGAGSAGTSAQKVLAISNGVAPTAAVAGVGQLYVEAGALKYRGSSGTITTIANA